MWFTIFSREGRLNKAAKRYGAEGIGIDSETMADLIRPAVVVPFGDEAEMQFLEAVRGAAQAEAQESAKAQIAAALLIRQDSRGLCLAYWLEIPAGYRQEPDSIEAGIHKAREVIKTGRVSGSDVLGAISARHRPAFDIHRQHGHHICASDYAGNPHTDQNYPHIPNSKHQPHTPFKLFLYESYRPFHRSQGKIRNK